MYSMLMFLWRESSTDVWRVVLENSITNHVDTLVHANISVQTILLAKYNSRYSVMLQFTVYTYIFVSVPI